MQELPARLTFAQLNASFTGRKLLAEAAIRRNLVYLWMSLPLWWAALLLAEWYAQVVPSWVWEHFISYPNLIAVLACYNVSMRMRHKVQEWGNVARQKCGHMVSSVLQPWSALVHWLVHVGDDIPTPQFQNRQQLRRTVLQQRRRAVAQCTPSAARTNEQQPQRHRIGRVKRARRRLRRAARARVRCGQAPKTQRQLDVEQFEEIRDANVARLRDMSFHLEVHAAALDAAQRMSNAPPPAETGGTTLVNDDGQPTSWRNPHSGWYRAPRRRLIHATVRTFWRTMLVLLLIVAAGFVTPVLSSPRVRDTLQQVGELNYLAAEVKEQQLKQLQELREAPYDPGALTDQFSHGINSHLPMNVPTTVDPTRYYKDPESRLVIDRVPGVTQEQLQMLTDLLRRMAPKTVAYEMQQITGYEGKESPMQISLDTNRSDFCPSTTQLGRG